MGPAVRLWQRWPDPWSPNCPSVLQSMIPALTHKTFQLHGSLRSLEANVRCIIQGCGFKKYRWGWWWMHIRVRFKGRNLLQWDTLTAEARAAHRWPQHKWVSHLNAMNQLLAVAPCRWLRRLYAFCHKPFLPLDTEGTWIYAIWSTRTQRIYVGQTGGIGQLKKTIVRFMQHIRSARSWHSLYGRRGIRGMGLLYPTMFRLGPENFGVAILEACPKNMADVRELLCHTFTYGQAVVRPGTTMGRAGWAPWHVKQHEMHMLC